MGRGRAVCRLVQIPNFGQRITLRAPLISNDIDLLLVTYNFMDDCSHFTHFPYVTHFTHLIHSTHLKLSTQFTHVTYHSHLSNFTHITHFTHFHMVSLINPVSRSARSASVQLAHPPTFGACFHWYPV